MMTQREAVTIVLSQLERRVFPLFTDGEATVSRFVREGIIDEKTGEAIGIVSALIQHGIFSDEENGDE